MFKKKDGRDELIILCDELENCNNKLCRKNEVVCAKRKIRQHVGDDINKLLKLKALVKIHDDKIGFSNFFSTIVSVLSFCLVIIYNIKGKENLEYYSSYALGALILLLIITGIENFFGKKKAARKKWKKYIEIVLGDYEITK